MITEISFITKRQIGIIIDRRGNIEYIIIGNSEELVIPKLNRFGLISGKLRGIRLIRTDFKNSTPDEDDIADLALLRLDSLTVISVDDNDGLPISMSTIYLLPEGSNGEYSTLDDKDVYSQRIDYDKFIEGLEDELGFKSKKLNITKSKTMAVLTGAFKNSAEAARNLLELKELARTANLEVIDNIYQIRNKIDAKYVVGTGKLKEIVIKTVSSGAEYLIYDNTLTPSQSRMIAEFTEIKVIDRTQLILDIFANRAKDNDGRVIVELAQLKYILPRLGMKDDSLSRLTGGIGGKGPGETKLEIDKRKVTDRIAFLKKKLKVIEKSRVVKRHKRTKKDIPIVAVIGYTNAGKTTLLNNLSNSSIYADDMMFATLETSSRRIRFPEDKEIILIDTVGFIRNLPENLLPAFKSTLEEIKSADYFIHLVDCSDQDYDKHIESVEKVLEDIDLINKNRVIVFNKVDMLDEETFLELKNKYKGEVIFISALDKKTYTEIIDKLYYYFSKSWE